jgi:hypothetical protein
MAHVQKPGFVFRQNGRVLSNRRGRQFSRLLAAEMCASAVVMLDTPCSEVLWRVLVTHYIRQFPLRFPSRASPCAITFQLDSTTFPGVKATAAWMLNYSYCCGLQLWFAYTSLHTHTHTHTHTHPTCFCVRDFAFKELRGKQIALRAYGCSDGQEIPNI